MLLQATVAGLSLGAVIVFLLTWAVPVVAYLLYRRDKKRADGYISGWGVR